MKRIPPSNTGELYHLSAVFLTLALAVDSRAAALDTMLRLRSDRGAPLGAEGRIVRSLAGNGPYATSQPEDFGDIAEELAQSALFDAAAASRHLRTARADLAAHPLLRHAAPAAAALLVTSTPAQPPTPDRLAELAAVIDRELPEAGQAFTVALQQQRPEQPRSAPLRAVSRALRVCADASPADVAALARRQADGIATLARSHEERAQAFLSAGGRPEFLASLAGARRAGALAATHTLVGGTHLLSPHTGVPALAAVLPYVSVSDTEGRRLGERVVEALAAPDLPAKGALLRAVRHPSPGAPAALPLLLFADALDDAAERSARSGAPPRARLGPAAPAHVEPAATPGRTYRSS